MSEAAIAQESPASVSGSVGTNVPASGNPSPDSSSWVASLSQDHKGYVENKGFKDVSAIVDSYRNMEKLIGVPKERLLKLPEKDDDPTWNDIYGRLGKPEKAENYELKPFNEDTKEFTDWMRGAFYDLNLTKKQAESLNAKMNDYWTGLQSKAQEIKVEKVKAQEQSLRKEWGAAYDKNVHTARKAAMDLKLDANDIDALESALGFDRTMKLINQVGTYLGEDRFVSGASAFDGALSPAAARDKMEALKRDPEFVKRYTQGDYSAKQEMDRLHRMMFPGE